MISKLDFVAVPSTDWERSRAFYVDTLGLRPDDEQPGRVLGRRDLLRHLRAGPGRVRVRAAATAHLAFHVDDIAAARAEFESRGVEFFGETMDTGVCHMAFFADPDGNALMLHSRYAPVTPS